MPDTVCVAMLSNDEHHFTRNWAISWTPLVFETVANEIPLRVIHKHSKSYDIDVARNEVVKEFMGYDDEWLLFIDADMGWDGDALPKLLASADPVERPIVGALCFGYTPYNETAADANGHLRYAFPVLLDGHTGDNGDLEMTSRFWYKPNALQRVWATGAAFLLVHRSAFERIAEKYGEKWFAPRIVKSDGQPLGEDVSFCARANAVGVPVYVDTRVHTSHWKPVYVSESFYWQTTIAPPALEEIDVVVPVLGRPHHAERFMATLRASTGLAHVTAVASVGDDETAEAWRAAGADVIVNEGRTTFAQKVNDGYRATGRPWLLFCGSDVIFRPGWWDHAYLMARVHRAAVVATNDMLNGDVRNGNLATHPVMRRDYIDELGASWDGPCVVAHEGYKHWWVDAEWSMLARQRGMFVSAIGSVVEHLHYQNGKADDDEVYQLGQRYKSLDRELFEKRAKKHRRKAAA